MKDKLDSQGMKRAVEVEDKGKRYVFTADADGIGLGIPRAHIRSTSVYRAGVPLRKF